MCDFLSFRNKISKQGGGQLLFFVLRLRHWLDYEYNIMKAPVILHKDLNPVLVTAGKSRAGESDLANRVLIEHFKVSHLSWDEAWWRSLREKSKAPLFKKIGKYM